MRSAVKSSATAALMVAVPLFLLAIIAVTTFGNADQRVVLSFFVTVSLALSIQAFSGTTGIMSFGHVAFMGVGAYVAAALMVPAAVLSTFAPGIPSFVADQELPLVLVLPVAFVIAGLIAGLVGLVMARMEGEAMAMATVSLLLIFVTLFSGLDSITGGAQGVYAIPEVTTIWIGLGVAVLFVFGSQLFARSRIGIQLRASRSSALAAESLGVNLRRQRWIAWTLAGAMIGLAGAVWAGYSLAFSPNAFGFDLTFSLLSAIVVGGLYSVTGTVVGAATLTVLFEVMRRVEDSTGVVGLTQITVAVVILLILYRYPTGLLGLKELPEAITRRRRAR